MNKLTATNTIPVTTKVMEIVESMVPQLEAIGVKYQGLRKWNRTEPRASRISAIAIGMLRAPGARLLSLQYSRAATTPKTTCAAIVATPRSAANQGKRPTRSSKLIR